ncbi:rRNA small subunit methyltransferase B [Microbacterium azadirachtae]|uniref:Ribosomal RNA small subunit methyltransferase B n=1 Tax=Microbacterium azadirachtae TaxID=582680 RepID=A0A0F0KHZ5_9MICO|nr:transcription antitermination factor NusB [Microbacterium azadirachtae]KJL18881.1 Ribosomal RNA small subunit methyltransferase B [Microbacterium azadirachtae]UXW87570.1 rRNA small subunit methyltransferase B [Microbacterium azadirachtae]
MGGQDQRNRDDRRAPQGRTERGTGRGTTSRRGAGPQARSRTVQPARRVAYDVIRAVSASDAYANLLLPGAIRDAGLSGPDAALATELAYGTLRQLGTYDAIIARAAGRDVASIDPPVLDALRLGVHQLLGTRVAPHAAVNETVNLVAGHAGRGASGFANAVLRTVAARTHEEWLDAVTEAARSDDERLGLRFAHPVWIIRALRRALAAEGREDELEALLASDNAAPEVTLVALPGLAEPREPRRPYAPTAFGSEGGDPGAVVAAAKGRVRVQDEGSQLVALALVGARPIAPGERWLDLCAGPGGKTALLAAEALRGGATLDANEVVPARAGLVRKAVAPVPLPVDVAEEDGRELAAERPGAYDRILLDAPCTGLGALRRRPEARWRKTSADVPELAALQEELLAAALGALKPGGVLAYVTCSPHLAETAAVVQTVLRDRDDVRELDAREVLRAVSRNEIDLPAPTSGSGHAQLWPHRHGTDAMFLSLLRKDG